MNASLDVRYGMCLAELQTKFRAKADSLKQACLALSERLKRAAAECDKARADQPYSINGLGEVQGAGLDIDRACAELAVLNDMRGLAKWLNEPPVQRPTRALRKGRN